MIRKRFCSIAAGVMFAGFSWFAMEVNAQDIDSHCFDTKFIVGEGRVNQDVCGPQYLVKGMKCYGDYCEALKLTCCRFTERKYDNKFPRPTRDYWSQWLSEEAPDNAALDPAAYVQALTCRGKHCDQKSVKFISHPDISNTGQCYWSRYFSEESPNNYQCSRSEFVSGVRCRGSYCDDVSIYCCRGEMKATADTSAGPAQQAQPGVAGRIFRLRYVDSQHGNQFDAVMEFAQDLRTARWRYATAAGNWHTLQVTGATGQILILQGQYTESGTAVRESYNLRFDPSQGSLNGNAILVFTPSGGASDQRNYQVTGTLQ
jgi:type II secretory pathway pseudopilin PulG